MKTKRFRLIIAAALLLVAAGMTIFFANRNSGRDGNGIYTAGEVVLAYKWQDKEDIYHLLLQRYEGNDGKDHYYDVQCDEDQYNFAEVGDRVNCEWEKDKTTSPWYLYSIRESPLSS